MLLAVHMAGTAEALQMGVNWPDPVVLSEIMRKSSGGNWSLAQPVRCDARGARQQ